LPFSFCHWTQAGFSPGTPGAVLGDVAVLHAEKIMKGGGMIVSTFLRVAELDKLR
jgi:hypothetical protein